MEGSEPGIGVDSRLDEHGRDNLSTPFLQAPFHPLVLAKNWLERQNVDGPANSGDLIARLLGQSLERCIPRFGASLATPAFDKPHGRKAWTCPTD